jgi:tryptophanase
MFSKQIAIDHGIAGIVVSVRKVKNAVCIQQSACRFRKVKSRDLLRDLISYVDA